jgi:hypothetical protein
MMKKFILASSLLIASVSANAGVVSAAGGVSWKVSPFIGPADPNLDVGVSFTQWWNDSGTNSDMANAPLNTETLEVTPASLDAAGTAELVGIGSIFTAANSFNAQNGQPYCNGCQLTFSFGGFFRTANLADPSLPDFNIDDAWLNVYLDYDMNSRVDVSNVSGDQTAVTADLEVAKAVNGQLWLGLDIEEFFFTPISGNPNPNAAGNVNFSASVKSGLDGGIARDNIVNDTFSSLDPTNFSDVFDIVALGFSATFLAANGTDLVNYARSGAGNINAKTVSEPGAIALFSLGLIGLGLSARRRMNK